MNPSEYTYFIDRTDFDGGDNGYEVPIAVDSRGTWFASFARGHLLETTPVADIVEVNTGKGWRPITYAKCRNEGDIGGHNPHIVLRDCRVETVALFVDDGPPAEAMIRWEGHEVPYYDENGWHFPRINWTQESLSLGQSGYGRTEDQVGTNYGDSGVPTFVEVNGMLAFLCQEITLGGRRSNYRCYLEALQTMQRMAAFQGETIEWKEVRFNPATAAPVSEPTEPTNPPTEPQVIIKKVPVEVIKEVEVVKEVPVYRYPQRITCHMEDGRMEDFNVVSAE